MQPHSGGQTPTAASAGSGPLPDLIGSILHLLGLDLAVPDHSTLSRRAETLEVPQPQSGERPVRLLVDSTGLRLCGPGELLLEKHGTKRRRAWKKLHLATDADTGHTGSG